MHFGGESEVVGGVESVVDGEGVMIDSCRLGDERVEESAEAECFIPVAHDRRWMDHLFEGGKVGVGDLCSGVVGIAWHGISGL